MPMFVWQKHYLTGITCQIHHVEELGNVFIVPPTVALQSHKISDYEAEKGLLYLRTVYPLKEENIPKSEN